MLTGRDTASTSPGGNSPARGAALLIRDCQSCLPLSKILGDGDLVVLLTPVVPPLPSSMIGGSMTSDPFEPLGRALGRRHPWIRHVPYTARGITSTHVGFIKRAAAVVFVISGPPGQGQTSQVELSEIARSVDKHKPYVIAACCGVQDLGLTEADFPTVIQLSGYSPVELESAADLLFRSPDRSPTQPPSAGPNLQSLMLSPKTWPVEVWSSFTAPEKVHELWNECMPLRFQLDRLTLQSLLRRDGYAKHYVVREPETREILGFCATYTTYIDSGGEKLMGSLSAIIVRPSSRQRGVGLSLHDHALLQLRKTRGVHRLQLGSTFPRLLYGLPLDAMSGGWFRRRGWQMNEQVPGAGQEVCDWLLRISDWPSTVFPSSGLSFRPCELAEFDSVLAIVERESIRKDNMGWYDLYAKLANTMHVRDIIIGIADEEIVATALTYAARAFSPVAEDLPWAATIGDDVGGVTCICITDDTPALMNKRDAIMIRLVDECARTFTAQGSRKVLIDAIRGGDEVFRSMGFNKWARYRDIWRKI